MSQVNASTVLGIVGSPRAGGNTELAVKTVLEAAAQAGGVQTRLVTLAGKRIAPCQHCGKCRSNGLARCAQTGDDFAEVFEMMVQAEAWVVGSPVHCGSATPQTLALLDRAIYVARNNGGLFARKVACGVVIARRAGHNFTLAQLLMMFNLAGMVVPGATYWPVGFGRGKGEVASDDEGMQTFRNLGKEVAWLLKCIRSGRPAARD